MTDNFCPSSEISDLDYATSQVETGIYEIEFERPDKNPWGYKYYVRVGGGWRGYMKKIEARNYYKQD